MQMKLSVIIPAFNEENYLPATLESIRRSLGGVVIPAEIITVDNESTDRTAQIAAEQGAKVVSEKVRNISKVRNTGANNADGDILIFIDADTRVPGGLFEKIAEVMTEEKCFGGAVAVDYERFERLSMRLYQKGWKFWGEVFNMKQGAAQFCRREIFEQINGYDETIFLGEDIEFYWRLTKFARSGGGHLSFIEKPKVVTSARRFDKMSLWKTFLLTNPFFIFPNRRRKSVWKDWYEKAVR
jgi:glycosyltransferase involved in cell wall biosynthesis